MKTELALYQALISINVPEQKANAVIEALETDMLSRLATKADLTALAAEFKSEISQLEVKLTIRHGRHVVCSCRCNDCCNEADALNNLKLHPPSRGILSP